MCGLCGNYNGNQGDDFLTPSGLVEVLLEDFGNSWKLNADCQDLLKQDNDPCNLNPHLGIEFPPKLTCAVVWQPVIFHLIWKRRKKKTGGKTPNID